MATGLYRDKDEWVQVDYGNHRAPMSKRDYETRAYQPPFNELPTKEQYEASKEKK